MRWRNAFWTIALCFGLGLGLAPAVRSAHACSCADISGWDLALEQIEGEGDPTFEQTFWSSDATIFRGEYFGHGLEIGATDLHLRRVP
jgi:hypothetical protein